MDSSDPERGYLSNTDGSWLAPVTGVYRVCAYLRTAVGANGTYVITDLTGATDTIVAGFGTECPGVAVFGNCW